MNKDTRAETGHYICFGWLAILVRQRLLCRNQKCLRCNNQGEAETKTTTRWGLPAVERM